MSSKSVYLIQNCVNNKKYIEANLNFPELKEDYLSGKINPQNTETSIYTRGKYSNIRGVNFVERDNQWRFILKGYKTVYFKTKQEAEEYAIKFLKEKGYY